MRTVEPIDRFMQLYAGGDHMHGEWDKEKGDFKTLATPAVQADFQRHIDGEVGLGLCPVRSDGTMRFGAIDIDVDTIDHAALLEKVRKRGIPLNVCRSKSGGAHCYLITSDPRGIPTGKGIALLKRWASLIGYPRAETFPKQAKISKTNLGNWINLPYFAGDKTVRYAVGPQGALTLDEFLDSVTLYKGDEKIDVAIASDLVQIGQMPPCLATLTREGLPEGGRNQGLLNFGIFYRKSNPNGWEDMLVGHNQVHLKPPLPNREVQTLIRQVGKARYQYTCDVEPCVSRCDRKTCLSLQYGIGNKPWDEAGAYDECLISHMRKIGTDPPKYIVEVNGRDVELTSDQIISHGAFKKRVFERLDLIVPPMKADMWEQQVRDLLTKKEDIEAPRDASSRGAVQEQILTFISQHERTRDVEEVLRDRPVKKDGFVIFKGEALRKHMKNQRHDRIETSELFAALRELGGTYGCMKILGKSLAVWKFPIDLLNEQQEDFTAPQFNSVEEEL